MNGLNRIDSGNLIEGEPTKDLLSKTLPNINSYVIVSTIVFLAAIINQKRCVASAKIREIKIQDWINISGINPQEEH